MSSPTAGLVLRPFRAVRPAVDSRRLGGMLCPPYDVIDATGRAELLARDTDNAVGLILPEAAPGEDPYRHAADLLAAGVARGLYRRDPDPAVYVYEMADPDGTATRGLLGAVELRDPADGVILPHEDTMPGPVADRLALMQATQANLEPIYLVYDGGGAASQAVQDADRDRPLAETRTPDGISHRLWALTDPAVHSALAADLAGRRALIADGHHRYATYLELQREYGASRGPGPWDRGLTLLVDSSHYGPQIHAIHRVLVGVRIADLIAALPEGVTVSEVPSPEEGLARAGGDAAFAAVLCDGSRTGRQVLLRDTAGVLSEAARTPAARTPAGTDALAGLDVTVVHRGLVEAVLGLRDSVEQVGYAHSVGEALEAAQRTGGTAVLLRPTPVGAVTAVAASGGRMPRKSTLFTPKPASGLLIRRLADEPDAAGC